MSSKQHFCLLLVPIAYCVTDFLFRRRSLLVAACMSLVFLLGTLAAKDVIGRPLGNCLLAYGALTSCTLACLLATGSVVLSRARSSAELCDRHSVANSRQTDGQRPQHREAA